MMAMEISKNRNLVTIETTKRDRTCQPTVVITYLYSTSSVHQYSQSLNLPNFCDMSNMKC
jgi:hypothetical protein